MSWIVRVPLAYTIRKPITVQVYGDYPKYATPYDEMVARMLHITPNKNKLHNKQSAQSVTKHTAAYKIDNRGVYDILAKIYKDTDLYPYVKQHKPKRDGRGTYYTILEGKKAKIMSMPQHQKLKWLYRCLHMMARRRHGNGKSTLPDMSSTISSLEIL